MTMNLVVKCRIFFLSHRQLLDQPKQVLHQIESRLGIPHHDYANDTLALQHNSNSCSGWPCSPVRSSERYSQGYRIPDSIKRFFASHVAAMQIELANFIDHSDWIVESMWFIVPIKVMFLINSRIKRRLMHSESDHVSMTLSHRHQLVS